MVRWFKLFGDQYLGFWLPGLVLFLLQEVPYMVMPLFHPETNPIMQMTETSMTLDLCEKILGSLCMITPFVWMVLTAFKTKSEAISVNPFPKTTGSGWSIVQPKRQPPIIMP